MFRFKFNLNNCQSIIRYGFECLSLPEYKLSEFDLRQNKLIKNALGLNKFASTSALLDVLHVESIECIYYKHKIMFNAQIMQYSLSRKIYECLSSYYKTVKPTKSWYFSQIFTLLKIVDLECSQLSDKKFCLQMV